MSIRVHFLGVLLELVWLDERYLGLIAAPPPLTLIVKFATQWDISHFCCRKLTTRGKFHNFGVWLFRLIIQEGEPGFVYKVEYESLQLLSVYCIRCNSAPFPRSETKTMQSNSIDGTINNRRHHPSMSRSDPKTWQYAFLAHRQSRLVQKHILRGHIFQDYGKVGKNR